MTLREIDALIAEKVMEITHPYTTTNDELGQADRCALCGVLRRNHDYGIPHYTVNPTVSKLVREKLAEQWDVLELTHDIRQVQPKFKFKLEKYHTGRVIKFCRVQATAEELAVALCALKSVGIEVEITP